MLDPGAVLSWVQVASHHHELAVVELAASGDARQAQLLVESKRVLAGVHEGVCEGGVPSRPIIERLADHAQVARDQHEAVPSQPHLNRPFRERILVQGWGSDFVRSERLFRLDWCTVIAVASVFCFCHPERYHTAWNSTREPRADPLSGFTAVKP